jgi:hypothetical protein
LTTLVVLQAKAGLLMTRLWLAVVWPKKGLLLKKHSVRGN